MFIILLAIGYYYCNHHKPSLLLESPTWVPMKPSTSASRGTCTSPLKQRSALEILPQCIEDMEERMNRWVTICGFNHWILSYSSNITLYNSIVTEVI